MLLRLFQLKQDRHKQVKLMQRCLSRLRMSLVPPLLKKRFERTLVIVSRMLHLSPSPFSRLKSVKFIGKFNLRDAYKV